MAAPLVFGEYSRKLDERYRLSLPSELVDALFSEESDAVLVKEQTGALSLWNAKEWSRKYQMDLGLLEQKLAAGRLDSRRHDIQSLGRLISTRHRELTITGRSRVLIPEGFREFLGASPGEDLVIIGAAVCIELWRTDAWQAHLRESIPDFGRLFGDLTA